MKKGQISDNINGFHITLEIQVLAWNMDTNVAG